MSGWVSVNAAASTTTIGPRAADTPQGILGTGASDRTSATRAPPTHADEGERALRRIWSPGPAIRSGAVARPKRLAPARGRRIFGGRLGQDAGHVIGLLTMPARSPSSDLRCW